jgi:2,3-bisphosphoglycerate-independent phosphoglycerate mutase
MKIAVLVGDGMGDYPLEKLGGKTPLQFANISNIRRVAAMGTVRLMTTIPEGLPPGSDVANLSIMGFDPGKHYTGRAPIEAAGAGVDLAPDDVAFRCNLITVAKNLIADHSAGHITTGEAEKIIADLGERLGKDGLRFHVGTSYRHLLIWKDGPADLVTTPPHDVLGQPVSEHLPKGKREAEVRKLMEASKPILAKHPVNLARHQAKQNEATQIWLWGQGRRAVLPSYQEAFGLTGGVITAVDLVRGIGRLAGLEANPVPGATGFIDTNYEGKVQAALETLQRLDFVFVHVEAPDECSHMGDLLKKIGAIEAFDRQIVGPMLAGLQALGCPYRLIIGTDHCTPVSVRNHTRDPVPVVVMEGPVKMALAEKPFDETVDDGKSHGLVFEWLKTVLQTSKP